MLVGEARSAARAWVLQHAAVEPGYRGAFFTGSTTALDSGAELPRWSDVDVVVVVDGAAPPKVGKLAYGGVLVDVSHVPAAELAYVAVVARTHYLAPSFRGGHLLDDPTGLLQRLESAVAPDFATLPAVLGRCEDVLDRAGSRLRAPDPAAPFEQQLLAWLFPAGLVANAVVVAALRPPTVRLRYLAAREVLRPAGGSDRYEQLLEVLGCRDVRPATVRRHLHALTRVFDAAVAVARPPLPFSSDITAAARPVAIDGSRALVDAGDHREAVWWIVATWARCQQVLGAGGGAAVAGSAAGGLRAAASDLLGALDTQEIARRTGMARDTIPGIRVTARRIAELTAAPASAGRAGCAGSPPRRTPPAGRCPG